MQPLTAQQLAHILGGTLAAGSPAVLITGGVSTDTRKLPPAAAFFALRGASFNGDEFAAAALAGGASVAVVHHWSGPAPANTTVLVVPDTLLALQRLAGWWRQQLELPVVAITGSNGKTSTKDFTAAVLAQQFKVSATQGNLNNHIGVPLTVLATTPDHTAAVWEMGMNHRGELAPLCQIAQPGYGIITNIGSAHLEFMGTREAIAEEKAMLARALPATGVLILPAACEFHNYLCQSSRATPVSVGNDHGQVRAANLRPAATGTRFTLIIEDEPPAEVNLTVPGHHMVTNALLAAAAGWKLGLASATIAAGLNTAVLTNGRLRTFTRRGVTVIDDTYNANPESMAAAIATLAEIPLAAGARRLVVLGRMGELGAHAAAAHQRTGALAATMGLTLIAVGEGAEGIAAGAGGAPHFPQFDAAAAWLARELKPGDAVLFKGSRSATVERVMHTVFPST
jgi:UDP-N-acetylmuramoyl-tripeptide--D-alanyl-D-alanine ligase